MRATPAADISVEAMRALFLQALEEFCVEEVETIRNGVSERNLCQRLSFPLERLAHTAGLNRYRADTEYNRSNDGRVKAIVGEHMEAVSITCDLILHSRGGDPDRDNLIAIEMKRSTHPAGEKRKDRIRLMALTREPFDVWSEDGRALPEHVCDYVVGYFIELDARRNLLRIEEYVRGKMTEQLIRRF